MDYIVMLQRSLLAYPELAFLNQLRNFHLKSNPSLLCAHKKAGLVAQT